MGNLSPKWRMTSLDMPALSGVEGPGELGLGGVVGEGGVEMDGDMG